MNLLDMRTVIFSYIISNAVCMFVIAVLWMQNRRQFEGLGFWLADFIMQVGGVGLVGLRGRVPDILSITVSNTLIIFGTVLLYMGLERFVGKRGGQIHNYILVGIFMVAFLYFEFAQPSLQARNILLSLGLLAICSQGAWLLLRRVDQETRRVTGGVGLVLLGFCMVSLIRIAIDLEIPVASDIFHFNVYDISAVLIYQMLFIVLTFNLFLMVNRRLVIDLSRDIIVRKLVESALRQSEEKFSKAFHSTPDAMLITRLRDGQIIDVNEGFCRISGYTREEALSSSTVALNLWVFPQDRDRMIGELQKNQGVQGYEFDCRTKSGSILHCLYAGEIIQLGSEAHVLSVVRDITESKHAEEIVRLRLRLWEYGSVHAINELMQKGLDEIGALTRSPIGFYHTLSEDQETLTLQAWSTNTRIEFCRAEGQGMHYPVSEAGVWVDCVLKRKPVIHNDYASLPHRRGLPTGHAEIIRELVVPILRQDRVVAILGVGNKPSEYDEEDVELVAYIADIIWTIIEQRRADEQIRQLNSRLEQMAMTDELTSLYNRRSFFLQGRQEIKRAQRYEMPLSLLMLDIDHFKQVNDTHGHDRGDLVLQSVANTLRDNIRETDILARLGGEEFCIMLPNTGAEEAARLGERLRAAVEQSASSIRNQMITVSIGVASHSRDASDLDSMLRVADRAMYQAKKLGRNRVVYLG